MFLLCCVTDLPRVIKRKDGDSVEFCNNVLCDKCRIIPSDERSLRPSHAKFCKIDNASVQKHVRWIFVMFYLFIYLTSPN